MPACDLCAAPIPSTQHAATSPQPLLPCPRPPCPWPCQGLSCKLPLYKPLPRVGKHVGLSRVTACSSSGSAGMVNAGGRQVPSRVDLACSTGSHPSLEKGVTTKPVEMLAQSSGAGKVRNQEGGVATGLASTRPGPPCPSPQHPGGSAGPHLPCPCLGTDVTQGFSVGYVLGLRSGAGQGGRLNLSPAPGAWCDF